VSLLGIVQHTHERTPGTEAEARSQGSIQSTPATVMQGTSKGGKHIFTVSFSSSQPMQAHNSVSNGKAVQKSALHCNVHFGQATGITCIARIDVLWNRFNMQSMFCHSPKTLK